MILLDGRYNESMHPPTHPWVMGWIKFISSSISQSSSFLLFSPLGPSMEASSRQVSDQELMKVANQMGKRWKQIGIQYLGIKKSHLEQIEEENPGNVPMRAFYMLVGWRNREKEKATASQLYHILNQDGVELDQEAYEFLLSSA